MVEIYGAKLRLTSVGSEAAEELLPVYNSDERFLRWSGCDSGTMSLEKLKADLQETLNMPAGKIWRIDDASGNLVGSAETVVWPNPETAWIALLLIRHEAQSQGYGSEAANQLENFLLTPTQIRGIGLAVLIQNTPGLAFWEKRGYIRGEQVTDNHNSDVYKYYLPRTNEDKNS